MSEVPERFASEVPERVTSEVPERGPSTFPNPPPLGLEASWGGATSAVPFTPPEPLASTFPAALRPQTVVSPLRETADCPVREIPLGEPAVSPRGETAVSPLGREPETVWGDSPRRETVWSPDSRLPSRRETRLPPRLPPRRERLLSPQTVSHLEGRRLSPQTVSRESRGCRLTPGPYSRPAPIPTAIPQGYLAHKKQAPTPGPPYDPTVGSWGGGGLRVSDCAPSDALPGIAWVLQAHTEAPPARTLQ